MSMNIELSEQEIAQLRQLTQQENDARAVTLAAREYLRLRRLRELKAVSGKVDFVDNWKELEERELNEANFPQ